MRLIDEARTRLKKAEKDAARSKAASKATLTKDQQALRAQMEADRRERASRGPSQGSKAQALPQNGGLGNTTSLRTLVPEEPPEQEQGPPM